MTRIDRKEAATRLYAWAASCPSNTARSAVPELADIRVAAQDVIDLIATLDPNGSLEAQAVNVAQLEVLLFDELADRLANLKPKLEQVSIDLSDAVG
jgi:hypothetical protein